MPRIGVSLIAQARMLAGSDPRRPQEAPLRRAISTAYYGMFHFLIEESTRLLLGTTSTDAPFRELAARSFEHGKMKSVCKEFLKPNAQDVHLLLRPFWGQMNIVGNQQLVSVAQTFIDLQDERHEADYDSSVALSRNDALSAVSNAEAAVVAWRRMRVIDPDLCRLFALALILWGGLAKRT